MVNVIINPDILLALLNTSRMNIEQIEECNQETDMSDPKERLIPQVLVKNIFENCRSALDYVAQLMIERYKLNQKKQFFPICFKEKEFEKQPLIKYLSHNNQELYKFLKKIQPFSQDPDYLWLLTFQNYNNNYKHNGFIPLTTSFCFSDGSIITLSANAGLQNFTLNITNADKPYVKSVNLSKNRKLPVILKFEDQIEVVPFLLKMTDGIYHIIATILQIG